MRERTKAADQKRADREYPVKVSRPDVRGWGPKDLLKELIEAAGDVIAKRPSVKPFDIVLGMGWWREVEDRPVQLAADSKETFTLSRRLMVCHCFNAVKYDDKMGNYEAKLVEVTEG